MEKVPEKGYFYNVIQEKLLNFLLCPPRRQIFLGPCQNLLGEGGQQYIFHRQGGGTFWRVNGGGGLMPDLCLRPPMDVGVFLPA